MTTFYTLEGDDRRVVPCDVATWQRRFDKATPAAHVVGRGMADDCTLVSTVFTGLDTGWGGGSPPRVYETLVYWREPDNEHWRAVHDADDVRYWHSDASLRWQYATWDEAVAGHEHALDLLRTEGVGAYGKPYALAFLHPLGPRVGTEGT